MSGLSSGSIDLAATAKREIARVLKNLLADSKFSIAIGNGVVVVGKEVNPTLGNNFQMDWDSVNNRIIIHNDFPIYSGGDYYYIDITTPATDKYILLATLSDNITPYNHIFLVSSGNPHIGNIEIVATANLNEPIPLGTKLVYIGCAYRGSNDEINIISIGRLIDLTYIISNVSFIDYLDLHESIKLIADSTNILRFTAFFGPNITKTINEVMLFIKDETSFLRGFAYSPVATHIILPSENLRVAWKITI
jgi:hypothetical protein